MARLREWPSFIANESTTNMHNLTGAALTDKSNVRGGQWRITGIGSINRLKSLKSLLTIIAIVDAATQSGAERVT